MHIEDASNALVRRQYFLTEKSVHDYFSVVEEVRRTSEAELIQLGRYLNNHE